MRSLATHIEPGFLLVDAQGFCLYANQTIQRMTGFSAEELATHPISDLLFRTAGINSSSSTDDELRKAFLTDAIQNTKLHFYRKDGTSFHAVCNLRPIRQEGRIVCLVVEVGDISHLRHAVFKEVEAQLTHQLTLDVAKIGTWECNLITDLVNYSPLAAQMFGIGKEQMTLPLEESVTLVLPEDLPLLKQAFEAAIKQGKPFDLEFRIRRRTGEIRWVAAHGMSIRNAEGYSESLICAMFDINDKKRIEEDWRAAEASYRLAIEAANVAAWKLNLEDGTSTLSPIGIKMLHLPDNKATLQLEEWRSMIYHEDVALVSEAQETAIRTAQPFQLEFRMHRGDGKIIWIASRGIVKYDHKGKAVKAIGVMIDITAKKEAEDSLLQNRQRLSLILETCSEGIFGIDPDCRCTFMNKAAATLLGFEANEAIGQLFNDWLYL